MRQALSQRTFFTALLVATLSCRSTTAPANPAGCYGPVQVAVLPGASPIFTWSPACGISSFSIVTVPSTPGATGEWMWGFSVPEQKPVGPAVLYGTAPAAANLWGLPPRALVAGATYRVRVQYTVGLDGVSGSGERVFTQ